MAKNKSDNKLLEESTKLRWAKLANLSTLKENLEEEENLEESEDVEEILTQNQARARGTDRLNENPLLQTEGEEEEVGGEEPEGMSPEMPAEEPEVAPEMGGEEEGSHIVSKGDVEELFNVFADAMTGFTGVPVEVSSDGAGEEASEMEPEVGGEESAEMAPPSEEEPEVAMMMERHRRELKKLKEEKESSPVGAKTAGAEAVVAKKTTQPQHATLKDPMKGDVRVKGAEKPTQMESDGSYYGAGGHKYKTLEEKMVNAVHKRIMEDLKALARKVAESKKKSLKKT